VAVGHMPCDLSPLTFLIKRTNNPHVQIENPNKMADSTQLSDIFKQIILAFSPF